ncbi:MAG: SRPBCC family protein [Aeromicrobium sp.]
MTSDRITVERTIKAPAASIFALLADAAKHSEFDGSGTVRGTRQSSRPLTLGTRFGMSMHMGFGYRTSNEVVEFEPDRRIAWRTTGAKGLIGGRIWRYELEPTADGTHVSETWDISKDRQRFFLKRTTMPAAAKNGMRKTLDRLAETLEVQP